MVIIASEHDQIIEIFNSLQRIDILGTAVHRLNTVQFLNRECSIRIFIESFYEVPEICIREFCFTDHYGRLERCDFNNITRIVCLMLTIHIFCHYVQMVIFTKKPPYVFRKRKSSSSLRSKTIPAIKRSIIQQCRIISHIRTICDDYRKSGRFSSIVSTDFIGNIHLSIKHVDRFSFRP